MVVYSFYSGDEDIVFGKLSEGAAGVGLLDNNDEIR